MFDCLGLNTLPIYSYIMCYIEKKARVEFFQKFILFLKLPHLCDQKEIVEGGQRSTPHLAEIAHVLKIEFLLVLFSSFSSHLSFILPLSQKVFLAFLLTRHFKLRLPR